MSEGLGFTIITIKIFIKPYESLKSLFSNTFNAKRDMIKTTSFQTT